MKHHRCDMNKIANIQYGLSVLDDLYEFHYYHRYVQSYDHVTSCNFPKFSYFKDCLLRIRFPGDIPARVGSSEN